MTILNRGVFAMSLANAVALISTIASFFLYSRLLTPAEFGLYAGALLVAKLGTTLLDGGLKTSLIKHHETVSEPVLRGLFLASSCAALVVLLLAGGALAILVAIEVLTASSATFFALYGAAYFTSYPFLFIPLAQLERDQHYSPVARSEALSITIEYALPAILWIFVAPGFWSFVAGAWLGRVLRSALILQAVKNNAAWLSRSTAPDWDGMRQLFREGIVLQLAVTVSMVRDSLHLIIVGPWFGKEWVGIYAWALQLCGVTSQVFVQTAARVSLPALRLTQGIESRWRATLIQIRWLTMLTAPPLVFLTELAPVANRELFQGKWVDALLLLPFLVARMLPGMATTPLGSLVLADRNARAFALANIAWTAAEFIAALLFLTWTGPIGLAWSYALMAWIGVVFFLRQLPAPVNFVEVILELLLRPSVWTAVVLTTAYSRLGESLGKVSTITEAILWATIGMLCCLATEKSCRGWLVDRWHNRS